MVTYTMHGILPLTTISCKCMDAISSSILRLHIQSKGAGLMCNLSLAINDDCKLTSYYQGPLIKREGMQLP